MLVTEPYESKRRSWRSQILKMEKMFVYRLPKYWGADKIFGFFNSHIDSFRAFVSRSAFRFHIDHKAGKFEWLNDCTCLIKANPFSKNIFRQSRSPCDSLTKFSKTCFQRLQEIWTRCSSTILRSFCISAFYTVWYLSTWGSQIFLSHLDLIVLSVLKSDRKSCLKLMIRSSDSESDQIAAQGVLFADKTLIIGALQSFELSY